jgi:dihydroneopterin aldolase
MTNHKILIEGIKLYAFHGCLPEEGKIGGNYTVDVTMETDFSAAAATDDLSKTIDYVDVYNIVKAQMAIRSKLIEHVGQRIITELKKNLLNLRLVEVKITKHNPPMNGNVSQVSVVITA